MAPFKSESQRRKFYAMAERGDMSKAKVAEYERKTKKDLPEKVESKEKHAAAKAKAVKFKKKKETTERG